MIKILGSRGTIPVSGVNFTKYGGNTSSLFLQVNDEECIIFDCGTGVTLLNSTKYQNLKKFNIFFSHLHWDHIIGLPILKAMYNSKVEINIFVEKKGNLMTPADFLKDLFKPPFFPVSYSNLRARLNLSFVSLVDSYRFNGVEIFVIEGNHPDGSLIYRVNCNGYSLVYATDYEHSEKTDEKLVEFAKDVNYLIYDTTYFPEDYEGLVDGISKLGWGHSTYKEGIRIAQSADAKTLVLFHHNPEYTDSMIDEMFDLAKGEFSNTICASDGIVLY
ncbi:MAG: MBL fold metallo-hydrolase [Deferribacterales bacterium]